MTIHTVSNWMTEKLSSYDEISLGVHDVHKRKKFNALSELPETYQLG
jgi:hypothetical protein